MSESTSRPNKRALLQRFLATSRRVEQHVQQRRRDTEQNRPSPIGGEVGVAIKARNVEPTAPAQEYEHVRGCGRARDAGGPEGARHRDRGQTNLGRFCIRPTSCAIQPSTCSTTPSLLSFGSPCGVPRNSSRRTIAIPTSSTASRDSAST